MKKQILFVTVLIVISTSTIFGQDIKFPELNLPDSMKNKQTNPAVAKKDDDAEIKKQALEFFDAVLNENIETIFKYVHPRNISGELTKKVYIEEIIKPQLKDLSENGGLLEMVKIVGVEKTNENNSPQFLVKHITSVSTPEGKADFEGLMKVYQSNGKNYFIGEEKAILESFGIKEFEDEDEDDGEENPVIEDNGFKPTNKGVLNKGAISLPAPKYPKAARAANITGAVNVEVVIDKNGKVTSAKAISGHPLLQKAAEKAALEAKFKPTKLSGQPVEVTGIIIYNFN